MSLTNLPSALRTTLSRPFTTTTTRSFSTTPPLPASVLFALNALSNSRETQHFNKLSHLSRIEHSPPLKLIQTSEVDAYPLPTPLPPFHSSVYPAPSRVQRQKYGTPAPLQPVVRS